MRGYADLNPQDEYQRVTGLQNNGIPCPYCIAEQGHYNHCPLLAAKMESSEVKPTPEVTYPSEVFKEEAEKVKDYCFHPLPCIYDSNDINVPAFTEEDRIRSHSLGVKL